VNDVITIDGPAGSGKTTVSRLLAKKIKSLYLDTGAMYRAVAFAAKKKGVDLEDGKSVKALCRSLDLRFITDEDPPRLVLNGEDISRQIRTAEMDMLSSKVSAIREVRETMTELQRKIAQGVRVVAEGRDMGTVVFPDAEHKFFLTASSGVRTERRFRERLGRGETVSLVVVKSEMKRRDHQDQTRSLAPLKPAEDAKVIDSTRLSADEVVEEILRHMGKGR